MCIRDRPVGDPLQLLFSRDLPLRSLSWPWRRLTPRHGVHNHCSGLLRSTTGVWSPRTWNGETPVRILHYIFHIFHYTSRKSYSMTLICNNTEKLGISPQDIHRPVTRLHFRLAHIGRRHTNTLVSSNSNLFLPRTERRFGDRAFSVAAPRAWNRLPTELKLMRSSTTFKRHLQTFLFNSTYISH